MSQRARPIAEEARLRVDELRARTVRLRVSLGLRAMRAFLFRPRLMRQVNVELFRAEQRALAIIDRMSRGKSIGSTRRFDKLCIELEQLVLTTRRAILRHGDGEAVRAFTAELASQYEAIRSELRAHVLQEAGADESAPVAFATPPIAPRDDATPEASEQLPAPSVPSMEETSPTSPFGSRVECALAADPPHVQELLHALFAPRISALGALEQRAVNSNAQSDIAFAVSYAVSGIRAFERFAETGGTIGNVLDPSVVRAQCDALLASIIASIPPGVPQDVRNEMIQILTAEEDPVIAGNAPIEDTDAASLNDEAVRGTTAAPAIDAAAPIVTDVPDDSIEAPDTDGALAHDDAAALDIVSTEDAPEVLATEHRPPVAETDLPDDTPDAPIPKDESLNAMPDALPRYMPDVWRHVAQKLLPRIETYIRGKIAPESVEGRAVEEAVAAFRENLELLASLLPENGTCDRGDIRAWHEALDLASQQLRSMLADVPSVREQALKYVVRLLRREYERVLRNPQHAPDAAAPAWLEPGETSSEHVLWPGSSFAMIAFNVRHSALPDADKVLEELRCVVDAHIPPEGIRTRAAFNAFFAAVDETCARLSEAWANDNRAEHSVWITALPRMLRRDIEFDIQFDDERSEAAPADAYGASAGSFYARMTLTKDPAYDTARALLVLEALERDGLAAACTVLEDAGCAGTASEFTQLPVVVDVARRAQARWEERCAVAAALERTIAERTFPEDAAYVLGALVALLKDPNVVPRPNLYQPVDTWDTYDAKEQSALLRIIKKAEEQLALCAINPPFDLRSHIPAHLLARASEPNAPFIPEHLVEYVDPSVRDLVADVVRGIEKFRAEVGKTAYERLDATHTIDTCETCQPLWVHLHREADVVERAMREQREPEELPFEIPPESLLAILTPQFIQMELRLIDSLRRHRSSQQRMMIKNAIVSAEQLIQALPGVCRAHNIQRIGPATAEFLAWHIEREIAALGAHLHAAGAHDQLVAALRRLGNDLQLSLMDVVGGSVADASSNALEHPPIQCAAALEGLHAMQETLASFCDTPEALLSPTQFARARALLRSVDTITHPRDILELQYALNAGLETAVEKNELKATTLPTREGISKFTQAYHRIFHGCATDGACAAHPAWIYPSEVMMWFEHAKIRVTSRASEEPHPVSALNYFAIPALGMPISAFLQELLEPYIETLAQDPGAAPFVEEARAYNTALRRVHDAAAQPSLRELLAARFPLPSAQVNALERWCAVTSMRELHQSIIAYARTNELRTCSAQDVRAIGLFMRQSQRQWRRMFMELLDVRGSGTLDAREAAAILQASLDHAAQELPEFIFGKPRAQFIDALSASFLPACAAAWSIDAILAAGSTAPPNSEQVLQRLVDDLIERSMLPEEPLAEERARILRHIERGHSDDAIAKFLNDALYGGMSVRTATFVAHARERAAVPTLPTLIEQPEHAQPENEQPEHVQSEHEQSGYPAAALPAQEPSSAADVDARTQALEDEVSFLKELVDLAAEQERELDTRHRADGERIRALEASVEAQTRRNDALSTDIARMELQLQTTREQLQALERRAASPDVQDERVERMAHARTQALQRLVESQERIAVLEQELRDHRSTPEAPATAAALPRIAAAFYQEWADAVREVIAHTDALERLRVQAGTYRDRSRALRTDHMQQLHARHPAMAAITPFLDTSDAGRREDLRELYLELSSELNEEEASLLQTAHSTMHDVRGHMGRVRSSWETHARTVEEWLQESERQWREHASALRTAALRCAQHERVHIDPPAADVAAAFPMLQRAPLDRAKQLADEQHAYADIPSVFGEIRDLIDALSPDALLEQQLQLLERDLEQIAHAAGIVLESRESPKKRGGRNGRTAR